MQTGRIDSKLTAGALNDWLDKRKALNKLSAKMIDGEFNAVLSYSVYRPFFSLSVWPGASLGFLVLFGPAFLPSSVSCRLPPP